MEMRAEKTSTDVISQPERNKAKEETAELKNSNESKVEEHEEGKVEAAEPIKDPDENEADEEQKKDKIRENLDHAKKLLKIARRREEGGKDQLCFLEACADEFHETISALESMFEEVNEVGSIEQKREFNILMKIAQNFRMECLHKISWLLEERMKKWNYQEKKYFKWKKSILKYLRHFPEDITVQTLIEDYMEDSKEGETIKEKIEGCESVKEALKKIDSIYDRAEAFRVEEEKMKIPGICREHPCYESFFEKENAKTILKFVLKVEAYNKKRDESSKYHLGRRFQLKFLSKLSDRSARDIVLNGVSLEDTTMKTYKEGLENILKRFPDYPKEWFVNPRERNETDEEEDEKGYETDEEVATEDDEEGSAESADSCDSDYDYQ